MVIMLEGILAGIVGGVSWSLMGYFKSKKKSGKIEQFNEVKFGKSILIGLAVGVSYEYFGVPYDMTVQGMLAFGAVGAIENGLKALFRRLAKKKNLKLVVNAILEVVERIVLRKIKR